MNLEALRESLTTHRPEPCYEPRLQSLRRLGINTALIEKGMADVLKTLNDQTRSFVIYGEPQSGKTEFMIALTCKLIDEGYETIFILMNDNTELEEQNFNRFRNAAELNPSPKRDFEINNLSDSDLRQPKQRVIFCRKNSTNLSGLIDSCRHMRKRVVIDDEADYATPNAKVNKEELTKINEKVGVLGQLGPNETGTYIGVTATPGRLDLNNTFLNDARKWVFLESHDKYKGRSFFFPTTDEEIEQSDYRLVELPDEGDDPKHLRHSVYRFLVRVAIKNIKAHDFDPYTMLIHTSGQKNDHERDEKELRKVLKNFQDPTNPPEIALKEIYQIAKDMVALHHVDHSPEDLIRYIFANIGRLDVLIINSKHDSKNVDRACNPTALFTFAIGGNIVSRGLTFTRLLTFYFSRNVKGKLQQNTYIQRARMFGNRPYSDYFELCVPGSLFNDWADCFAAHELSLRTAKAGHYVHVQTSRSSAADSGSIDKATVETGSGERPAGELFELTDELERRLVNHDGQNTYSFVSQLIQDGLIPERGLPPTLLSYIGETSKKTEEDVFLVLRSKPRVLHQIERHKDADHENILRSRGGMIHALLKGSKEATNKKHYILPVRNEQGLVRIFYRSNMGHAVLTNKAVRSVHSVN